MTDQTATGPATMNRTAADRTVTETTAADTTVTLAPATEADLPEIARLHIGSWQDAYRGILDDAFLDDEVPVVLSRRWAALPVGEWIVTTARGPAGLLGFIATDCLKPGGRGAYVDNLHAAPQARRLGVGRRLMADTARQLVARGETRMWLTVLADNHPSRAFYRAMGGQEHAVWRESLFGAPVQSVPVEWHDLAALAARD